MKRLLMLAPLALGGCGAATDLQPEAGKALPVAAYGATKPATATQLITPPSQSRPERSDELLKSSEERRSDEFDLPPN